MAEIRGAQTNTNEQANAPKENVEQQASQGTIAEGSAAPAGLVSDEDAHKAAAGAQTQQTSPATSSTQADGGAKTEADQTRAERDRTPAEKADAAKAQADAEAAKAAGAEMVKVAVDGVEVEVPKGTLAIEACFRAGADVPYFCYHPRLTSVGACRMCLVNIEMTLFGQKSTRQYTCCTVPVADGMAIDTRAPDVKKAQNGMLEFLLANHPLDCPICDRGGECPLQNMTIAYGPPTSRFIEEKRHWPKAYPLSDYVVLDRERCIQCMRCTRFTEEISGDGQLAILNRSDSSEIGTFFGHDFTSNFSGNTIELCPVGALLSRSYRFAARPWEISSSDTICSRCGNGCNVVAQSRLGELVRINGRTNEDVNEEWTCDRGKFGNYYVNDEARLKTPLIRKNGQLVPSGWDEALALVAGQIQRTSAEFGPDSIAALGSSRCTVEDNYLLGKMLRALVGTNNLDHRLSSFGFEPMQTTIAEIEHYKVIVSVSMKLDLDQPIVYLRVYKGVRKRGAEWVQSETMNETVADALRRGGADAVLLLPHTLAPADVARAQSLCQETGAKLNVLLPDCNSWGVARAGILPDRLPGMTAFADGRAHLDTFWKTALPPRPGLTTDGMFDGLVDGSVRLLYVMGSDPAAKFYDVDRARRALEAAPFLVVQELFLTETARRANVVFPASSFAEKDGTFVNIEGREQKIKQAIAPKGDSRPDWRIIADLMARLGRPVPYFSARDIYREYTRAIPKPAEAVLAGAAR